jgi:glycosyltransferase involved in cell wall biosynthesis
LRLSRIREDNSSVVHPAINYAYRMMEKGEARRLLRPVLGEIDRPFLMHVGNNSWYKNKKGLLAIFRQAIAMAGGEYNLVLVGPGLTAEMRSLIRGYGLSGRVKSLSGITAEQLCALYSSATALIFPSLAEGFGWPVIEAQACGCPVFASNRAPMTEVGGAAAAYFDPDDPSGAASVITHALGDPAIIGNMRKTGLENAESFTISRMACAYMEAYKNILRSY